MPVLNLRGGGQRREQSLVLSTAGLCSIVSKACASLYCHVISLVHACEGPKSSTCELGGFWWVEQQYVVHINISPILPNKV